MREMSIQTLVAIYGAVLSTGLGMLTLLKFLREKPRISVDAQPVTKPASETSASHGVLVRVRHGHDVLLEEADVEMTVSNAGGQGCQITDVFIETATSIQLVRPEGLPVVLATNTSCTVLVQPELFAPKRLSDDGQLIDETVLKIGVFDAVGNKHRIPKKNLIAIVDKCRQLPLRTAVYQHKETGDRVVAFQVRDAARLMPKHRNR
jgi:hypothetical protein